VSSLHAAPRYTQNGYVQHQLQSSSLNRQSGHSRRTSEQDVVLPSIEKESVDFPSPRRIIDGQPQQRDARPISRDLAALHSPKRKPLHSFPEDGGDHYGYHPKRPRPVYYEDGLAPRPRPIEVSRPALSSGFQPIDHQSRPRAQPPHAVIDLTSSPRRPPASGDGGQYPSHARAAAGPSGISYIPVSSRGSPVRERRALHHEVRSGEPSRAYMPNSGMYERRAPPVDNYTSMRDEYQRRDHEEDGRYLRSGVQYGVPGLQ
jgi:hypothetical protein